MDYLNTLEAAEIGSREECYSYHGPLILRIRKLWTELVKGEGSPVMEVILTRQLGFLEQIIRRQGFKICV